MDNVQKFWVVIWAIINITIISVVAIGTNYWMDHNTKVVDLISKGVDPVAALCAMQDDNGNNPTCIVLAVKKLP